jgi:hypothetical protein
MKMLSKITTSAYVCLRSTSRVPSSAIYPVLLPDSLRICSNLRSAGTLINRTFLQPMYPGCNVIVMGESPTVRGICLKVTSTPGVMIAVGFTLLFSLLDCKQNHGVYYAGAICSRSAILFEILCNIHLIRKPF